ncbi:hypothetical protein AB1Y20_019143 [Prymnesium parvum]|uniref:RNase NYN domain-containing protein n=1 Tax=Prymnesium parvum TaxID=97485 RepID=A0AB34JQD4_PRYPA
MLSSLLAERAQLASTLGVSVSDDVFLAEDLIAEVEQLRQLLDASTPQTASTTHAPPPSASPAPSSGEELFQTAKAAEKAFTQLQQQHRPHDVLHVEPLQRALDEARRAYVHLMLSDPLLASQRSADARLWAMHSRPIDELQRRLRAAAAEHSKATRAAPPPDALLAKQRQLAALVEAALAFYDSLLAQLAPAAAGAPPAPPHGLRAELRPDAIPPPVRALASHTCLCAGDLRRYLATLPFVVSHARAQLAEESAHRYRLAATLAPSQGRPHNCLGVLVSAPQLPPDLLEATYRYVRALSCASPYDARSNLRTQLERMRRAATGAAPPPSAAGVAARDLPAWGHYLSSVASLLNVVVCRLDVEKIDALAASSLQALAALPHGVLPSAAALPVAALHIYLVHEAAREAGGVSREGVAPLMARLRDLPDDPPPLLRAVVVLLLRLLAHVLRALPRGGHMLPAAAVLASWCTSRSRSLLTISEEATADLLVALSSFLSLSPPPQPLPPTLARLSGAATDQLCSSTPCQSLEERCSGDSADGTNASLGVTAQSIAAMALDEPAMPEAVGRAATLLPEDVELLGFLPLEGDPPPLQPNGETPSAAAARRARLWSLAEAAVSQGLLHYYHDTGTLTTRRRVDPPVAPPPPPPAAQPHRKPTPPRPPRVPPPHARDVTPPVGVTGGPRAPPPSLGAASFQMGAACAASPYAAPVPPPPSFPRPPAPPPPLPAAPPAACLPIGAGLRHSKPKPWIIVDGPNVAIRHGKSKRFSSRGIELCLDYWKARGHEAIAVLPEFHLDFDRVGGNKRAADLGLVDAKRVADDVPLLRRLEEEGRLVLTPPQDYDDSYCLSLAQSKRGCVVSNDMYRDYVDLVVKRGGDPKQASAISWKKAHVISYTFLNDEFLPNPDFVLPSD